MADGPGQPIDDRFGLRVGMPVGKVLYVFVRMSVGVTGCAVMGVSAAGTIFSALDRDSGLSFIDSPPDVFTRCIYYTEKEKSLSRKTTGFVEKCDGI